jgi:hypothetical protein
MIYIKSIPSSSYAEVGQKAPLRWCVLDVADDGTAVGQHGWWKCKDFLNDSVIYLHTGKEFNMYGFQNKLKLNCGEAFVALKNVPEFFEENLGYLNEWLAERDMPLIVVDLHDGGCGVEKVITIDEYYFSSTYTISVITSLIRSCVYKKMVNDISECFAQEPTLVGYMDKVDKCFTRANDALFKKLLYKNYQYSQETPGDTYTIHNAGLQSWTNSGAFAECN